MELNLFFLSVDGLDEVAVWLARELVDCGLGSIWIIVNF